MKAKLIFATPSGMPDETTTPYVKVRSAELNELTAASTPAIKTLVILYGPGRTVSAIVSPTVTTELPEVWPAFTPVIMAVRVVRRVHAGHGGDGGISVSVQTGARRGQEPSMSVDAITLGKGG